MIALSGWFGRGATTIVFAIVLGACWVLGGASQYNAPFLAILELVCLSGLFLAAFPGGRLVVREGRLLVLLLSAFIALACLQLVPLPWEMWKALPGHKPAASGAELLELPKIAHPLSLAPEHTVSALLKFIPAVTIFLIALLLPWRVLFDVIKWGAPAAGVGSVILGLGQIFGGPWASMYFYEMTNKGSPVGIFANINHHATFLLMCLPFVAALAARAHARWSDGEAGLPPLVMLAGAAFMLLAGIAVVGSLAGYILAVLVVASCAMFLSKTLGRLDIKYLIGIGVLAIAAFGVAFVSPRLQGLGQGVYFGGERDRSAMQATTLHAAVDFAPFGSGLGTFEKVYPLYEKPATTESTFVNHAHNEYLEILLELGLPGLLLVIIFLAWWALATFRIWIRSTETGSFQLIRMAASLAVAVVLIHSLVDYPIRTPTIATFVAACLAIMVRTRSTRPREVEISGA